MKPPLTVNGLTLGYLCLRDWCELTQRWLATRQQDHETALRRSGATATEIAKAAEGYAGRKSAYGLLLEMCKTYDGACMILERAAQHGGILPDALHAALGGIDPDSVAVLAMRACGWEIKGGEGDPGNA
jgi:hypothetical protein